MGPVTSYGDCSPGSAAALLHRLKYQSSKRSLRAKNLLDAYSSEDIAPISRIDELANFLTDLHHYCSDYRVDLKEAMRHAEALYFNEI